ncbi:MAG: phytoene/squalene synthase family protein, partial [Patescibacteria group bacterium]
KLVESAEKGFRKIPKDLRVSVMMANDMYKWTAKKIEKNPKVVFEKKIKPNPAFVVLSYFKNYLKVNFMQID